MTLSIPKDIYERVKKHPEVKWSQAARKGILEKLAEIEGIMKGSDFFESLQSATRKGVDEISDLNKNDWEKYYRGMKEKEWKRTKSSTRIS